MSASALRAAALDSSMTPPNGWLSSRMRKKAVATESAHNPIAATMMALLGAKSPKLRKRMVTQKMTTARKGRGMGLPALFSIRSQRARAMSPASVSARDLSSRCTSVDGDRSLSRSSASSSSPPMAGSKWTRSSRVQSWSILRAT